MTVRQLLGRFLIAAVAISSQGLYCQGGADCSEACDIVRDCPNLNKTYLLSCSRLGPSCLDNRVGQCAECITDKSNNCSTLQAGACDCICDPTCIPGVTQDAGPADAGTPDGGTTDGGTSDGGTTDAGM